jgi:exodeoxyribonuclease V alpha subunit
MIQISTDITSRSKATLWPTPQQIQGISEHQRAVLSSALATRISILGGTPGTGKTYTATAIIKEIAKRYGAHQIAFCAPTGKAANRGAELLAKHNLPIMATTIHRLLEVDRNGRDGNGWAFKRNEFNPLPQMFYFVDEASMLGTDSGSSFFRALPREAHVLLVGDIYQLPPVEHGAPLRDMIDSGLIGYGELTEIHRNAGDIVHGCKKLKDGLQFTPNTWGLDLTAGRNWIHRPAWRPEQQIQTLLQLLATVPPQFNRLFDIQVICATNETKLNPICREALNKILQPALNPENPLAEKQRFALRDKVICNKNSLFEMVQVHRGGGALNQIEIEETGIRDFVANGEIGQVCRIEEKRSIVKLLFPLRYIAVPLSSGGEGSAAGSASNFDLAYAITCHKSQGSQMPIVIVMLDDSNGANWVTSREWHYTAISRAEKICMTIGKWETLMRQSKRVSLSGRKTFLVDRLNEVIL